MKIKCLTNGDGELGMLGVPIMKVILAYSYTI